MNRADKRRQRKLAEKAAKNANPVQSASLSPGQQTLTTQQAINLAVKHQTAGDLPKAEGIYRQILQTEPNHPDALHLLGMIAHQVGKYDVAVELINKSLAIRPDSAEVHNNLGNALKNLGRLDEAVASYRKAMAIKPDFALMHINLGIALKEQGKMDEAVASYRKALAIKPDFAEAHYYLGNALKNLGKLDEAVASYLKVLAIKPNYAEAHNNLGNAIDGLGKLDEAVASYQKALAVKPDYAEAYYNLGNALKNMRKLDEAVANWQKALAINPGIAEAYCNLGAAFTEWGKLEEAVSSCQKALAIKPDYADAHSNLGAAFAGIGNLKEAVASCHKALAINPEYAEAWSNLTFATKALQFSKDGGGLVGGVGVNGLSDVARSTIGYAIHQFYLAGFRPHEADESYQKITAALPAKAEQEIPINGADRGETTLSRRPDKVVALLSFGRSGTGLLHSLIDGHPEISTLPSVYLRGYFNQGVWDKLSVDGWRGLPERFANEFAVLFDARTSKPIPSRSGEPSFYVGKNEGMTSVGENRDEYLSLDREAFYGAALGLMEGMESIDPMSFLMVVHAAFEEVTGSPDTNKRLCFYHIHNPDTYAESNFLRHAPDARLLVTVREPIQNCESSIHNDFKENNYGKVAHSILGRLFEIDQIPFRMRHSVGIRLEDIKTRPEATIQALCDWLGVEDSPTLYEMTAQGKKWWGDPSSPDYANDKAMAPFDDVATKRPVGTIFGQKDQFVLRTLFYPFSVRFAYREADPEQLQKDLKEIRPLFDDMLDFEKAMAERLNIDHAKFKQNSAYHLLRSGLLDRWNVLNELEDYPHMLEPLSIK